MLFNSYLFLFGFLPPVLVGCWALRQKNLRLAFLPLSSWLSYVWWNWLFVQLLRSPPFLASVAAFVLLFFVAGRFRRMLLIADQLNPYVDRLFAHAGDL